MSWLGYKNQSGISYLEVLIAAAVIALSAVPISTALQNSLVAADHSSVSTVRHYYLLAKMEEVMSYTYLELALQAVGDSVPSTYSDDSAAEVRRLVYVSSIDGDNADLDSDMLTGIDEGLLKVRVEIEHGSEFLEALKSRR